MLLNLAAVPSYHLPPDNLTPLLDKDTEELSEVNTICLLSLFNMYQKLGPTSHRGAGRKLNTAPAIATTSLEATPPIETTTIAPT